MIAANHLFNAAPKDGTVIGNISGPIVLEQLFGNPAVQYDMAKFRYLAVPVSESYLMIAHKRTGITKFDDLRGEKGKQVTFGAIPGSTVEHAPIMVKEAAQRQSQDRFRLQRHRRRAVGARQRRGRRLFQYLDVFESHFHATK